MNGKIRESSPKVPFIVAFKSNLLQIIRHVENPVYNIYDILGINLQPRLQVNFSPLNEIDLDLILNV